MDHAKYEWLKKVRKMRDELKAKIKSGDKSYLARKIALRNKKIDLKTRGIGKKFDLRKQARIGREHAKWDRKSQRWNTKGTKFNAKWALRAARFNSRMTRHDLEISEGAKEWLF